MTEFSPVWLSTEEQLHRLADSYAHASVGQKLLGRFRFPAGTAHLRGVIMPWARAAIVYLAQGRLTIDNSALCFQAAAPRVFGWLVRDVDTTLRFEFTPRDIQTVEPFAFASPVARLFDLPLTRVRTAKPGLAHDFLVCVGGRVLIPRIRARSLELRAALELFARAA